MGQPRASRRRVVTISSDEDEESPIPAQSPVKEDDEPQRSQKRENRKLKPVTKASKKQQPPTGKSTEGTSAPNSPTKPKPSKGKSKTTAAKEPTKTTGRPIYSFFNAATQRQQATQPSASLNKPLEVKKQAEVIHDDSDDGSGSSVQMSKGSSVALAMRKRKVAHTESFEQGASLPPPASQKFRKTSSDDRVPALSVFNPDKRPWTEQFAPKDLSELVVHKKKVSDVRGWLEFAFSGRRQKVLVLKSAAGTGKTTTLRLLAQDLGIEIVEWRNPAGVEMSSEGTASASSQFEEFVGRAGRSGGLQFTSETGDELVNELEDRRKEDTQDQVLLVEEFPSTFSRSSATLQSFRSTILQYLSSPPLASARPTPLIMIISETLLSTNTALADSFTAHRLLGPELNNHPFLDTIEFNAVAPTYLAKALEAVAVKEARKSGRRKTPGPLVIKRLAESGDIRSAISSLEFLCLRGDDGDTWSSKVAFTKQKKPKTEPRMTKAEEEALKLISNRESTLGIFHAVGKVMYNKRQLPEPPVTIAHPPSWCPQHRRDKIPENNVDEMLNELGTDVSTFVAAIHENYVLSCSGPTGEGTLDSLVNCVNDISDADLLSVDRFSLGTRAFSGSATDSIRQDDMAFQTAVRGVLFNLPCPVHRASLPDGKRGDEHKMFYPSSLKIWKKQEETEGTLELLTLKYQRGMDQHTDRVVTTTGVGGWKKNSNLSHDPTAPKSDGQPTPLRSSSARMEMLMERLPYMAQIFGTQPTSNTLESILSVTRVRGTSGFSAEGEDEDGDERIVAATEQWSTDRPEVEGAQTAGRGLSGIKKKKPLKGTEGGGLEIPVESSVEKLVIEDDDIVDD